MEVVLNPWGILGVLALLVALTMAALVYLAAPTRPVNRWLALLLFFEGVGVTTCASGLDIMLASPVDFAASQGVNRVATIAAPFLYLVFLGVALDTPLTRPLRRKPVVAGILATMAMVQVVGFLYTPQFLAGLTQPWFAPWGAGYGPWFMPVMQFYALTSAFGLAAALHAYFTARSPVARGKAKAYAMAFGVRDLWWMLIFFVMVPYTDFYGDVFWGIVWTQLTPLVAMAFFTLLGHGILKTQLFDLDVRVKWTLSQGTKAALLVVVFFVASEGTESVVATFNPLVGLAAAGLFVLVERRLRLGRRVADAAMPGVEAPEHLEERKLQVYRAAVEGAWEDTEVTPKERAVLERLRAELGIGAQDAERVEAEVQRVLRPAAPA